MEGDLKQICKWKMTYIGLEMEDDLKKIVIKWKTTSKEFENGRQTQFDIISH